MNNKPLEGLKVLDFTIALSGVYISWQLADMGAEVFKIERYGMGDQSRYWDPFINNLSLLYSSYNKNKKSIELDLSKEEGKEVIYQMVKECDVVIENFKSGSIDRLGLGYEELSKINPNIVFLSLSGFGASGELKTLPCYDAIAAARGGLAATNGEVDGPPMKSANANCDTLTGTHALNAVLMGLIQSKRTGKGCYIDIGMADTVMLATAESVIDYDEGRYEQARFGNHDRFIAPYGLFECRDGWIAIIADNEEKWKKTCQVLDLEELINDEDFKDNESRIKNLDKLVKILEAATIKRKRGDLEKELLANEVSAAEVLPFIEAYTSDHSNKTNATEYVDQDGIGYIRFYNNPLKFNDEMCEIRTGAPLLGANTREVLEEIGYSPEEVEKLMEEGVAGESLK